MIKVTIGEVKPEEKPFPKLMINKHGAILLMFNNGCGAIINSAENQTRNGSYSDCISMHGLSDYNEPITIQNA